MSMYTFGPKLDYHVCILMFAYILHANDELYVCKLHSDFCKGTFVSDMSVCMCAFPMQIITNYVK